MSLIVGIDVGYTGAIAIFENKQPSIIYDMPVLKIGKKTELDEVILKNIFIGCKIKDQTTIVYVEKAQAMSGQGVASIAQYMKGYGQILGLLAGIGLSKTLVHPRTWKAKMMRDMEKEKQASVLRCKQLFPEFSREHLTLKKHHGRADAILIAAYGASL